MTAHIKILILNWNGKHLLKPCLDSVSAIDYPNYSVMVIDNGSTDNSVKVVKKNFVKLVETYRQQKTNGLRFSEKIVSIPEGKDPNQYLSELIKK